jgi:hypothetical protein
MLINGVMGSDVPIQVLFICIIYIIKVNEVEKISKFGLVNAWILIDKLPVDRLPSTSITYSLFP